MKTSEIKFKVTLDENKIPEKLVWEASESGIPEGKECKSAMIAVWDKKDQATLRIDLWTKEMMVDEMNRFFFECFTTMADTYHRATSEEGMAREIRNFATSFGKKSGVLSA
ncbi:MAG: gliding motility protein GldC [Bacteroidia bacterium]|nr:gliding motility protein GldC [Bacteroidia bacterium]